MSIYQLHKAIFINQSAGACFMTLYVTAAWPSLFESRQVCSIHKITPSDWVLLRYDVVATYLSIVLLKQSPHNFNIIPEIGWCVVFIIYPTHLTIYSYIHTRCILTENVS